MGCIMTHFSLLFHPFNQTNLLGGKPKQASYSDPCKFKLEFLG